MTRYKIVSLLDVSPFTFEELWRVSRNKDKLRNYESLRKQADELQQQLNYYTSPGKFVLDISEEKLKNLSTFLHKPLTRSDPPVFEDNAYLFSKVWKKVN